MAERRVERIGFIMFKKKLGFLLGVMVFLSFAGYLVCLTAGSNRQLNKEKEVLGFYLSSYPTAQYVKLSQVRLPQTWVT